MKKSIRDVIAEALDNGDKSALQIVEFVTSKYGYDKNRISASMQRMVSKGLIVRRQNNEGGVIYRNGDERFGFSIINRIDEMLAGVRGEKA